MFGQFQCAVDGSKLVRVVGELQEMERWKASFDAAGLKALKHSTHKLSCLYDMFRAIHKASISGITGPKYLFH